MKWHYYVQYINEPKRDVQTIEIEVQNRNELYELLNMWNGESEPCKFWTVF